MAYGAGRSRLIAAKGKEKAFEERRYDEELVGALEREKLGDYSYSKGKDFIQHMPFSKKQILSSYKLRKV